MKLTASPTTVALKDDTSLSTMAAWLATLIAMRKYTLTGERMRQIQAVNSARKEAVAKGMSLEEAMRTITDETVPK